MPKMMLRFVTLLPLLTYAMDNLAMGTPENAFNRIVHNHKERIKQDTRTTYLYNLAALIVDSARERTATLLHPGMPYKPLLDPSILPELVLQAFDYARQPFEQTKYQDNAQLSQSNATTEQRRDFLESEISLLNEHYVAIVSALRKLQKENARFLMRVISPEAMEKLLT